VLAALDRESATRYRMLEDAAGVDKRYLAVVHGSVETPLTLRRKIDMARRARVRVLPEDAADPLRATQVRPLAAENGRTLVEARIAKGARHQIRAHLAAAGHPIVGDTLYGEPCGGPGSDPDAGLRLHHWRMCLPGLCAATAPEWDEFQDVISRVMEENPCV